MWMGVPKLASISSLTIPEITRSELAYIVVRLRPDPDLLLRSTFAEPFVILCNGCGKIIQCL
jgi:hypothetical protein